MVGPGGFRCDPDATAPFPPEDASSYGQYHARPLQNFGGDNNDHQPPTSTALASSYGSGLASLNPIPLTYADFDTAGDYHHIGTEFKYQNHRARSFPGGFSFSSPTALQHGYGDRLLGPLSADSYMAPRTLWHNQTYLEESASVGGPRTALDSMGFPSPVRVLKPTHCVNEIGDPRSNNYFPADIFCWLDIPPNAELSNGREWLRIIRVANCSVEAFGGLPKLLPSLFEEHHQAAHQLAEHIALLIPLSSSNDFITMDMVRNLRKSDMIAVIEVINDLLHRFSEYYSLITGVNNSTDIPREHPIILRFLINIAHDNNCFPSSLLIRGISQQDSVPSHCGGFADVFRGKLTTGGIVALKHLRGEETVEQRRRNLFREGLTWHHLNHQHILPFYGIDMDALDARRVMRLVSPWMKGGTVLDYLNSRPRRQALTARMVANGIAFLHAYHIVHGDIRGRNVLIDERGHVRVADFGLSFILDRDERSVTNDGGSIRWMAPELLRPEITGSGRSTRSTKTDSYSFACFCLELFTLHKPWMACSSITNYHIIDKVVRGDRPRFPSPEECGGTANRLPSKLWNVITTCWHPNAADRLSMPEVMYELPVILEEARIQSSYYGADT